MSKEIKQQLRIKYLKILKNLNSNQKKEWDLNIYQQFVNSKYFANYQNIALYFSLSYEVDTIAIIKKLLETNKKIALPRIQEQNLQFYYIENFSDLEIDKHWNIYQPRVTNQIAEIGNLDLIILPLIAFNSNRYRLGHGKGYYDRYLSSSDLKAVKLVLAYQVQEIPSSIIFSDNWDVTFDDIIVDNNNNY